MTHPNARRSRKGWGLLALFVPWRKIGRSSSWDFCNTIALKADPLRMATLRVASAPSTVKLVGGCEDRATALIEDIRCEKIRGCSYS
jgi:hypothetical protein